ncbi:RNA-binding protein [Caenispirillum bisanense]|uniref:LSU ribosomal protein L7AE n=1 Tax=Caenispirillum bisanense TaxID=414052 RepID=A0A286GA59_9PROT|nr:RNA-binding protein [Caenispirillum bisanense]SOD92039.1 LSU ribosomal protein L7AE [Caenispirillum bisanense]
MAQQRPDSTQVEEGTPAVPSPDHDAAMDDGVVVEDGEGFDPEGSEPAGPHRRCIVSGEVRPREDLIRFVLAPDGTVVPDLENALPGRGLWLSPRRDMIETAMTKRAFARAARRKVEVPADLPDRIEALMRRKVLDLLGLARRAGSVTAGYDKVRALLKDKRQGAVVLLEASDGAADGRGKIRALAPDLPVIDLFTGAELGAVFGRDITVHAVISAQGRAQASLAERIGVQAERLARYRGGRSSC